MHARSYVYACNAMNVMAGASRVSASLSAGWHAKNVALHPNN
jgi:hypothetical protein